MSESKRMKSEGTERLDSDDDSIVVTYKDGRKLKLLEDKYEDNSEFFKKKKQETLTKTVDNLQLELVQLRNDNEALRYEIALIRKSLKLQKEGFDKRFDNARRFFGDEFRAHVQKNFDAASDYTVDNVVKLRKEVEDVEGRLTEKWEYNTSVVEEILDKESERSVALDLLLEQNKNNSR